MLFVMSSRQYLLSNEWTNQRQYFGFDSTNISHTCQSISAVWCWYCTLYTRFSVGENSISQLIGYHVGQQNLLIVHCSYTFYMVGEMDGKMVVKTWSCIEYVWNKNPSIKSVLMVHMCFTVIISEQIFAFFHFSIFHFDHRPEIIWSHKTHTHKSGKGEWEIESISTLEYRAIKYWGCALNHALLFSWIQHNFFLSNRHKIIMNTNGVSTLPETSYGSSRSHSKNKRKNS